MPLPSPKGPEVPSSLSNRPVIDGLEKLEPGVNREDGGLNSALKAEPNDGDGDEDAFSLGGASIDSAGGRTSISGSVGGCAEEGAAAKMARIKDATSAPQFKIIREFNGVCRSKARSSELPLLSVGWLGAWTIFLISPTENWGRRVEFQRGGQTE